MSPWRGIAAQIAAAAGSPFEPQPPRDILDATWPEDGALAPLRYIPQVLILVAQKPHV